MGKNSGIVRASRVGFDRSSFLVAGLYIACAGTSAFAQGLPPVPFPPENQFSVEKSTLGKILFWDEQLSSDSPMSCGTCHITSAGGADPRVAFNPGNDGIPGTSDDMFTSFGVIASDANEDFVPDPVFGLERQATGRSANPAVLAM